MKAAPLGAAFLFVTSTCVVHFSRWVATVPTKSLLTCFLLTPPPGRVIFRSAFGISGDWGRKVMSANHLSFARSRLARRLLIRGPVLAVAAVVVLLAQVGAGAAPGRSVSAPSVGKSILHPVGRAQATTMRATNSSPPAHAGAVPRSE